jgi:hypothetical protein
MALIANIGAEVARISEAGPAGDSLALRPWPNTGSEPRPLAAVLRADTVLANEREQLPALCLWCESTSRSKCGFFEIS